MRTSRPVTKEVEVHFPNMDIPEPFLQKVVFPPFNYVDTFVQNQLNIYVLVDSGLWIVFHGSICPPWDRCHTIVITFRGSPENRLCYSLTLHFQGKTYFIVVHEFFNILWILDLWYFCSFSYINAHRVYCCVFVFWLIYLSILCFTVLLFPQISWNKKCVKLAQFLP